ncbi:MAG: DUF1015 domain-containing protein [Candidatus Omnitrophota bacterium]
MANIAPFKGVRYNTEKIKDLSKVVAPPYDVISRDEQRKLHGSEEHNIIRVLLGEDLPGDDDKENKYTRAAGFLNKWTKSGVLKKDEEKSIYVYSQEFEVEGARKNRLGFMSLLKLEDFDTDSSSVYPHENTLQAPKEDRAKLISSINANLGPIFAVYGDEDRSLHVILTKETMNEPTIDIVDPHGIRNRLWRVTDRLTVDKIVSLMKSKKLFIADGHHRYEVGLMYSKLKNDPNHKYILTYFTDIYADGIVVLPVHRIISGISKDSLAMFRKKLEEDFRHEAIERQEIKDFLSKASALEKRFVLYDGRDFLGLSVPIKDKASLDVTVLHGDIIARLEKIASKRKEDVSIDFTKDLNYAIEEVEKGRASISIIVNPTKITEIRDKALSGQRMPQKSTYFYPKVLTGLVINIFNSGI